MKTTLAFAIALVGLTGGVGLTHFYALDGLDGWLYSLAFDEDTIYAEGYSTKSFRDVHSGMPESALLTLLGSPLGEVWIYGRSEPTEGSATVGFSGGVVDHIHDFGANLEGFEGLLVGMTKHEVRGLLGQPLAKSFAYSQSQHDQSYRVRTVVTVGGRVLRKRSYFYVD